MMSRTSAFNILLTSILNGFLIFLSSGPQGNVPLG
jgi:hypothetical protein